MTVKKIFKIILKTVGIIVSTVIVLFILLLAYIWYDLRRETEVKLQESSDGKKFILPVEIKGNTYNFLWDTGSDFSLIDYKLAEELGYRGDGSKWGEITTLKRIVEDSVRHHKFNISIGDLSISTNFILDGYHRYLVPNNHPDSIYNSPYNKDSSVGIIGQDIISRYRWLFNFKERSVKFSKSEIEVPLMDNDSIFRLNMLSSREPHTKLLVNQKDTFMFKFDTGNEVTLSHNESKMFPIIELSDSLFHFIRDSHIGGSFFYNETNGNLLGVFLDSLKINNLKVTNLSLGGSYGFAGRDSNYITGNFPLRFRQMYYDPYNKEISFYISPQDSSFVYQGTSEEKFINSFKAIAKEKQEK